MTKTEIIELCHNPPVLESTRLVLKPAHRDYEPYITTYLSDRTIRHPMRMPTLDSAEKIESWWTRFDSLRKEGKVIQWSAFHKETNDYVALVTVKDIDWNNMKGELGYSVLKPYWGQGYATESCSIAVEFVEKQLKFNWLMALILPDNIPSQGVINKLGFKKVETLQDFIDYEGDTYDLWRYRKDFVNQ